MRSPTLHAALAIGLVSGWMVALFTGFALGGAVHLVLLAALAVFPWRLLRESSQGD
ncbi:MAG: lmo0937 family membrane protein [Thermoanaerobaculia bacterium]